MPSSTIGTAMVGMRVARKFCRNRYITRKTSSTASSSVFTTSLMEASTNGVVSKGTTAFSPFGKLGCICLISASTFCAVASAFALVASEMAMPAEGRPL